MYVATWHLSSTSPPVSPSSIKISSGSLRRAPPTCCLPWPWWAMARMGWASWWSCLHWGAPNRPSSSNIWPGSLAAWESSYLTSLWLPSLSCTGKTSLLKAAHYSVSQKWSPCCVRKWNCRAYRTQSGHNMESRTPWSVYGLFLIILCVPSVHWFTHNNFTERRYCRSIGEGSCAPLESHSSAVKRTKTMINSNVVYHWNKGRATENIWLIHFQHWRKLN